MPNWRVASRITRRKPATRSTRPWNSIWRKPRRGSAISNIAQAQQEWREAVVSSDPKDFRKFQTAFKLAPEQRMWLDTRITLLQYERDLKAGYLTQAGKDARLDEIQKSVAMWPTSATKAGVQESLSESGKFSDLAKLVNLVPTADNSLQLVFRGFENAKLTADDMADLTGLPIMGVAAIDDSTVSVGGILLMNPEENGETVNYNIGTYGYAMKPGEKQSLTQSYVVSFDPGDGTAVKKVTLSSGVYQFVLLPGPGSCARSRPKSKSTTAATMPPSIISSTAKRPRSSPIARLNTRNPARWSSNSTGATAARWPERSRPRERLLSASIRRSYRWICSMRATRRPLRVPRLAARRGSIR